MHRDRAPLQTPEQEVLVRMQAEAEALQTEMIQRELDLATLQASLSAFERLYLRIVGTRYAELDAVEAEIARILADCDPHNREDNERAYQTQAQAQESARTVGGEWSEGQDSEQRPDGRDHFEPSEALRQLYRDVAKSVHPDLATDGADRDRRTYLMTEANRAYQERDERRLTAILREWESSPEGVTGHGTGAELIRVIRRISQIRERLRVIAEEIVSLHGTDLYRLKSKADEAASEGRDLLDNMVQTLERQVADARDRLASMKARQAS